MKKRSNGEGTICKRNDGRWMAQITIDTGNGEFKGKTVYGKTQKEVKEKLEQLKSDQKQGRVIETSDMPLEQWMNGAIYFPTAPSSCLFNAFLEIPKNIPLPLLQKDRIPPEWFP